MADPIHPGPPRPSQGLDVSLDPLTALLRTLELTPTPTADRFAGDSVRNPSRRVVYGGQVLAQALLAAGRTLDEDRLPHSLHGYFLRAGDPEVRIEFPVERLSDGRSFSARRAHAVQHGAPILSMIASFQSAQPGIDVAPQMPSVPDPMDVPSAQELLGAIDHPAARFLAHESPFEVRHVDGALYVGTAAERQTTQAVWIRARGAVSGGQLVHRALMAYACDQVMLEPILRASGHSWATERMSVASLDHAMWWHRDAHVDDWLLYVQTAVSAQGGRGLGTARVFAPNGTMVASIAQEGMIRVPLDRL